MSGQTVILSTERSRQVAKSLIDRAPPRAIVNVRESKRTIEQNSKLWAMLSDIARAKPEGRHLPAEIWKCLFMAACGHKVRFEPGLDGEGVVPMLFKSSRLTKAEMSDLIECMSEYGARHGVVWSGGEE